MKGRLRVNCWPFLVEVSVAMEICCRFLLCQAIYSINLLTFRFCIGEV